MNALRRIVRELRLSARVAEQKAGISGAQLFVLQALAGGSAASLNELADRTFTDQSSVSVVVKRLVARKLVARITSHVDARRIELALTPAGRRLLARCPEPTQVRLVSALEQLSGRDLASLSEGLASLASEMGVEGHAAGMLFEEHAPGARAR
jgi:DNA-binding MarR family transcriptional regulator